MPKLTDTQLDDALTVALGPFDGLAALLTADGAEQDVLNVGLILQALVDGARRRFFDELHRRADVNMQLTSCV